MTNHELITGGLFAFFGLCCFFLGATANNLDWKERLGSLNPNPALENIKKESMVEKFGGKLTFLGLITLFLIGLVLIIWK